MAKHISLKIALVALMLLVAMCFSACAEIRAMTIYNENGGIDEMVFISLDKAKIESAGLDYQLFSEEVFENAQAYANDMIEEFRQDVIFTPYSGYMFCVNTISKKEGDTIAVGLRFEKLSIYNYFHGRETDSEAEPIVEHHFLYDKMIFKGLTTFAYEKYDSLYQRIKLDFTAQYPEFVQFNETMLYTYVADNKREHSDADFVNKIDGKYYHTWQVESGQTDKVITLYYNLANRGHCVLLCLIVSLVFCGVLLLIGLIITQIKKRKNKKITD